MLSRENHGLLMLFTGREVRMGKNCVRGLEHGARPRAVLKTKGTAFSIRTDLARYCLNIALYDLWSFFVLH